MLLENHTIYAKRLIVSLLLITSLAVTYGSFYFTQINSEKNIQAYFDFRVREAVSLIEIRIKAYEQVLRGTGGLFNASKTVEREEFKRYISSLNLAENFPGIQGVGYSIIIPSTLINNHIEAIRSEGFPAYSIYPEGERDIFSSIIYLEPFSQRNLRAFGYDMFSEPMRHKAMQKAIDNDAMSLSGKVRLVQESGANDQSGFLMYLPVYENGKPHTLLADRQENIIGWVYAVFRMNDFISGVHGEQAEDLDVEIFDGDIISDETLMFDSYGPFSLNKQFDNISYKINQINVVNHIWTVRIRPSSLFDSRVNKSWPLFVGVIGTIASFTISFIFWLLLTGRERAIKAATNMNMKLIKEQWRLSCIIEGTHAETWEWNIQSGDVFFNEYCAEIIGYKLSELEPITIKTWHKNIHPDDLQKSADLLTKHFAGELPNYECEIRMLHKDGSWVWILAKGKVASWTDDGNPLLMFGLLQEINQMKLTEKALRHQSQHDALTGLPNRMLLTDRIQQAQFIASRNNKKLALMFIDLDKFKPVNDEQGHHAGDFILIKVAQRIKSCLRDSDTVARVGGDEFIVLLPTIEREQDASGAAEKILDVLNTPFEFAEQSLSITSSIGIAFFPEHGNDGSTLIKNADTAMYCAKGDGRNNVKIYQPN
ncbi:hypothetical protein CXF72_19120 [Psychromonas sp. MB-3u-54]|uniref:CHASE domain-containing protein n=1 Tax=Psychromonas sp. MB-3u-54 TaxID=2058319 RepID=UPI000C337131|nr:GGDEF domain-containing protein [Psychromonas sp. MB-3u-54]PKH01044.1 hypothetical protein CXF72_19120 [Psychromonas sp. MB-3u-54]